MRLPAQFSDNRFLDAVRDILRDTLTTTSIMTLIVIFGKRLCINPDILDWLYLLALIIVSLFILLWHGCIINRSVLMLISVFETSKHYKKWHYFFGVFACTIVVILAYSISGFLITR